MELKVLNKEGKETSKKVKLDKSIFGIDPNDHAIYLDVKQHLARKRQGDHQSKERGEIVGSTRKIKKQKGTGTARAGSIKNPLFRGGGRVFGPKPRYYGFKLNKKLKTLARKSALTYKAKENSILILEDLSIKEPKTKEFSGVLSNLKIADSKSLFVLGDQNENVYLSSRNLQSSKVITVDRLNTYDILNAKNLVIAESAVKKIEKQFKA
jgi:large subunit ribosomal protein L4